MGTGKKALSLLVSVVSLAPRCDEEVERCLFTQHFHMHCHLNLLSSLPDVKAGSFEASPVSMEIRVLAWPP